MTSDDSRPRIAPVTRTELEQVYGPDRLLRVPAADLPDGITDPVARAFLAGIGLPDAPSAFIEQPKPPLPPLTELYPDAAAFWPDLPDGGAGLFLVGAWGTDFALNGATGEVHALLPHQPATVDGRPAHRDIHSLMRCQLAFGAMELYMLCDLTNPDTADWLRAHVPGYAELCPVQEVDEEGWPLDEEPDPFAPDVDQILAQLTDKLRRIEPDLLHHPGWQSILQHFRYGY